MSGGGFVPFSESNLWTRHRCVERVRVSVSESESERESESESESLLRMSVRKSRLGLLVVALVTVAAISASSCCAQEESLKRSVGSFWSWLTAADVPDDGGTRALHRPGLEKTMVELNHLLFHAWDGEEEFCKLTGTVPGMKRFFQSLHDTQKYLILELTNSNETCGVVPRQQQMKSSWWKSIVEVILDTPWNSNNSPEDTVSAEDLNSEECLLGVLISAMENTSFVDEELDRLKKVVFSVFGGPFLPPQAKTPVYGILSLFCQISFQLTRSFFFSFHPLDITFYCVQLPSTYCCLLFLAIALFPAGCFVFPAVASLYLRRSEFHMDLIENFFAAPVSPDQELQQRVERARTSKFMSLFIKHKLSESYVSTVHRDTIEEIRQLMKDLQTGDGFLLDDEDEECPMASVERARESKFLYLQLFNRTFADLRHKSASNYK
jgi:hypothetical protein